MIFYMSKKTNNNTFSINNNYVITGYTLSITNSIYSDILTFFNTKNEEIMKISPDGEVYYRFNDKMIKVEIPEDLVEAFTNTILNYAGKTPDDIMIDKYIEKILKNEKSEEYISKLERVFRKNKIKKLNN